MHRLCRSRLLFQATSALSRQFAVPQTTKSFLPAALTLSCRTNATTALSTFDQEEQQHYPKLYVLKPRFGKGSGFLFFYAHRRVIVQAAKEAPNLQKIPLNLCETFNWFEQGKPTQSIILNAADVSRILGVLSGKEKRHEVAKLISKDQKTGGSVLQLTEYVSKASSHNQSAKSSDHDSDPEATESDKKSESAPTRWNPNFKMTLATKRDVEASSNEEFNRISIYLDSSDTLLLSEFLKESLAGMIGFGEAGAQYNQPLEIRTPQLQEEQSKEEAPAKQNVNQPKQNVNANQQNQKGQHPQAKQNANPNQQKQKKEWNPAQKKQFQQQKRDKFFQDIRHRTNDSDQPQQNQSQTQPTPPTEKQAN